MLWQAELPGEDIFQSMEAMLDTIRKQNKTCKDENVIIKK